MSNNQPSPEKIKRFIEILLEQMPKNPADQSEWTIDPDVFYSGIPTLTYEELLQIFRVLVENNLIEKLSIPTVPLQLDRNPELEIHRSIYVVPKPLPLLAYLRSRKTSSSYADWERSGIDAKKELTKDEIMKKIQDFMDNFPRYDKPPELPEKHHIYEVRLKEFIKRLHGQIGLSDEIRNHALAVFNESYTCPGYPKYNRIFDEKTNMYGQRYMGIRFFVLPLIKNYVGEYFDESKKDEATAREPIENHGLKIWPSRSEVECAETKKILSTRNWGIVSRCLADESWSTECDFLLGNGQTVDNVDLTLKDVNETWEKNGWRIVRRKSRRIILGAMKKRRSPPKTPRKPPVLAR